MLRAITYKGKIQRTHRKLQQRLKDALVEKKGTYTIGFQGGNIDIDSLRANDNIWYAHMIITEDSTPRYWNAFGLANQLNINASNPITVEINIPLEGAPRRVAGLFAVDANNKHSLLLHREKVGGGKKGIGKGAFLDWYAKDPVKVWHGDTTGESDDVLLVADLSSPHFAKQIEDVVCAVAQFKARVQQDEINSLSIDELQKKIGKAKKKPTKNAIETTAYERNPYIVEYAKRRAAGFCQLCKAPAPFNDSGNKPYLECHHIIWLSNGGEDTIENTVALCPNCHAKMHILNPPPDVSKLQKEAKKKYIPISPS
jgi:5-methylcytosine-specific restriction protein A